VRCRGGKDIKPGSCATDITIYERISDLQTGRKPGLFSSTNEWKIIREALTEKIRRSRNQGMTPGFSPRNTMEYYEF